MIKILSLILFILLVTISGKRGIKAFLTIYINLALIFTLIVLIAIGFNPILTTLIISLIISLLILFFLNGKNVKTIVAFISVTIIVSLFLIITTLIGNRIYIQGYTNETVESIGYVNYNTGINLLTLSNAIIIIGLIGNIIDTSIAISSSLYEIFLNNPNITKKELFISGINIGKDILGTTTNTLFFAYLGSHMTLLIFFIDRNYTPGLILNSKVFAQEFTQIILSGMASIIIIPLASLISTIIYTRKEDYYEKNEYNL